MKAETIKFKHFEEISFGKFLGRKRYLISASRLFGFFPNFLGEVINDMHCGLHQAISLWGPCPSLMAHHGTYVKLGLYQPEIKKRKKYIWELYKETFFAFSIESSTIVLRPEQQCIRTH